MKCKYHKQLELECIWCSRQKRQILVNNNRPQPFYIVIYNISRHYGGPEEGGWYYDWQYVLECRRVWSINQALRIIRDFQEEYPQPKYNRFSVLGGNDIRICLLPNLDFIYEDYKRPTYE